MGQAQTIATTRPVRAGETPNERPSAAAMLTRARRRTLSFGLQTVLGLRRKGFFIPLRNAETAAAWAGRPYEALMPAFQAAEGAIEEHLATIETYRSDLSRISGAPPEPRFDQSWFPRLDAAALYVLVRQLAPGRIVEVGSGHSTRFIARAIRDGDLDTLVTAIDPEPRADLTGLPLKLIRRPVQDAGLAPFERLAPGDLLVVDSSHVLMPGTDVDIVLNHVIPQLPRRVHVLFHDIFLPFPYPDEWPFTSYNEQSAVAALLSGGRARIVFSSAYLVNAMADALAGTWIGRQKLRAGARESALVVSLA